MHRVPPGLYLSEDDPVDTLLMELHGDDPDLFLGYSLASENDTLFTFLESDAALGSMLDRMLDGDRRSASV